MYIAPNTNIRLLSGVPCDPDYRNTIYFANQAAQTSYFMSRTKYSLEHYTYQREQWTARVGLKADLIYDCNYMMYQNTAYGNKWFYAFITSVEYVNNDTSEVRFTLDVMQTWHFDYTLGMSYVEREMSVTDKIGDNLVPENLEFGEYVYRDLGMSGLFSQYQIVIAATFDTSYDDAVGGMYGGVYSGLRYNVFTNAAAANQFIERATEKNLSDGIVSIFMLPIAFCADPSKVTPDAYTVTRDKALTDISGYVPRNRKLFTYPYNMLYVTNNEGVAANYPFEYFSTAQCEFRISGVMSCTPEIMLIPLNYKGVDENYNEHMVVANFPQCAYAIDSYKAFIAQNATRLAYSAFTAVGSVVGGGAMMYASQGQAGTRTFIGGLDQTAQMLAQLRDKSTLPPQARGGNSSSVLMANDTKGFRFYYAQITEEFAKIIDDFFSMYGYATHRVKIPNRVIRPVWNYTKTINANIKGNVPSDDLSLIRSVYDRGITWWRDGSQVGDYSLDNSPSSR